jgi:plastocyanin
MRLDPPGRLTLLHVMLVVTAIVAACDKSPASPTDPADPPATGLSGAYIVKIALISMDPASIDVPVGARVTFVNNDPNFPHHMGSACSELDAVGRLDPRQSGETAPFTASKTCNYYDRLQPDNPLRHGKIVVR